jgi:hypothetical protein
VDVSASEAQESLVSMLGDKAPLSRAEKQAKDAKKAPAAG